MGPVSLSSSGRVGVSAGSVSVYGGGRRRRRSSGGGLGSVIGVLFVFGLIITYWYIAVPVALAGLGLAIYLHRRDQARQAQEHVLALEQERAWLAGPPPALVLPSRFTDRWFADNAPFLHPGQVPTLLNELRARGWKDDRINQRLQPYLDANPYR